MPIRVFVYGTLKQGHGNHRLLRGSKYLGRSMIEGRYKMLSLGGFPGLVQSGELPNNRISGEVYQIDEDTLQSLDWLEGHPKFYERKKVPTQFKNAWCYFLPEQYLTHRSPGGAGYENVGCMWRPSEEEAEWFKGLEPAPAGGGSGNADTSDAAGL